MTRGWIVLCGLVLGSALAGQWTSASTPIMPANMVRWEHDTRLVSFEGEPLARIRIHRAAADAIELCIEGAKESRCASLSAFRDGLN